MKLERSDVDHPLWRKKVDSSLFRHNGTPIPNWANRMWGIEKDFSSCTSKKNPSSKVQVIFKDRKFEGCVTRAQRRQEYGLWYTKQLSYELKDAFLMSFARDIESRLRKSKGIDSHKIEDEIPFWEFLDIEYERDAKTFYFNAYYVVKPVFSELFKHFVESPIFHKIDDELAQKSPFRIYKTDWKPRAELEFELGATNVIYMLVDTEKKLFYIGEASNLVERLRQDHPSIPEWNYFRYNVLPNEVGPHRKTFERMAIRDFASILKGNLRKTRFSEYELSNEKIDLSE